MATIENYFEQAQLSLASYALDLQRGVFGSQNSTYVGALVNAGMSQIQAETFADTYAVIDQYTNPVSGFSGTVFQHAQTGVITFALRGTQDLFSFSGAIDWLANVADIGADGIAIGQGLDLFNWLQRLYGAPGSTVAQYSYLPLVRELVGNTTTATGYLSGVTAPVTVTGHSLGGHLAMMMSRLAPDRVSEVYTYNAPGFDTPLGTIAIPLTSDGFFNLLDDATTLPISGPIGTTWNTAIMSHLIVPGDVVRTIGTVPGTQQTMYAESANQGALGSHSVRALTDALAVYNLFAALDPTLNNNPVTGIAILNRLLQTTAGTLSKTLDNALDSLRTLFQQNYAQGSAQNYASPTFADRNSFYTNLYSLESYLKTTPFYNSTTQTFGFSIDTLTNRDASTLAANAQTDIATRYALFKLNPFVINNAPALYSAINGDGALNVYNSTTHTGSLTAEYLKDRANLLYNKIQANTKDHDLTTDSTTLATTWAQYAGAPQYFEDNSNYLPYKLYLGADSSIVNQPISNMNQIKFGSSGDDSLTGSTKWDKLYGGAGNDTITGGAGNDYIEGGQGSDNYHFTANHGLDQLLDTDAQGTLYYDGIPLPTGTAPPAAPSTAAATTASPTPSINNPANPTPYSSKPRAAPSP